jgi:hypothetical protein
MATCISANALSDVKRDFVVKAQSLFDRSEITTPPVDPKRLAILQGIRHIFLSWNLEGSGQILRIGGDLVIRLNAGEPPQRQNFSCCHEIAHTFAFNQHYPKSRAVIPIECGTLAFEEQLCDMAAAEMLMPAKLFVPAAAAAEPCLPSLEALARQFGASIRATLRRLADCGGWPVVFIIWKFTGDRHGVLPRLRVDWSARPRGTRCFVPRFASADERSGMYATFVTGIRTVETESLSIGDLRGRYVIENGKFGDAIVSIVQQPRLRRA